MEYTVRLAFQRDICASFGVGCPDTSKGVVWMTNNENGRRFGRELMRTIPTTYGWVIL